MKRMEKECIICHEECVIPIIPKGFQCFKENQIHCFTKLRKLSRVLPPVRINIYIDMKKCCHLVDSLSPTKQAINQNLKHLFSKD